MKKIHITCASLLVFLFFVTGCHTSPEAWALSHGVNQWRDGNYKEAIRFLENVLKRDPENTDAYMWLAWSYEDLGDYKKAKEYFSEAVSLDPRYEVVYDVGSNKVESADIRRGWREIDRGGYDKRGYDQAITSFNLALKKNPRSAEAYVGLAIVWWYKKDYDKAMEYYSKAIEIEPKWGYFWSRGEVWRKKKDFERAVEDYTSAINIDPTFAAAYTDRGSCYISMGKHETALSDYKKALELIPVDDRKPYAVLVRKIALKAIGHLTKKLKK